MRNSILLVFCIGIALCSYGQDSTNYRMVYTSMASKINLKIIGEESKTFVDLLFAHHPKTKRKGYIWKFKNIEISGLSEPITLQVHQGLHNSEKSEKCDSTKCGKNVYFTTFVSEKYKKSRLENRKPTEKDAILIYLKNGKNFGLNSPKDVDKVKAYLTTLYKG